VHVFRRVLQHAISCPRVRNGVDGQGLESSPPQGEDQGIVRLEDLLVPPVSLDANLDESETVFGGCEAANNDRVAKIEGAGKFLGHLTKDYSSISASLEALSSCSRHWIEGVEFGTVNVKLFL
jgi:hypothetical protein